MGLVTLVVVPMGCLMAGCGALSLPPRIRNGRWPTHPVWTVVQGAFALPGARPEDFGKVVRKRHRDHNVERMVEAVVGYASSLAAYLGDEYTDEMTDFSMVLHWMAQVGPEYLDRIDRDFAAEVQRKRIRFGVRR
jgi:hypothetical protein